MTCPTEAERKIREFIEGKGVTRCQPKPRADFNPASTFRSDDRRFNPFSGSASADSPERRLAMAKLFRMFQDLAGQYQGNKCEKEWGRQQAHWWFFGDSDFKEWCLMAGYSPDFVRKQARLVSERGEGLGVRAATGQGKRYRERKAARERKTSV